MNLEPRDSMPRSARRVIADLRELAALTSTPDGAQRVAWGPVWAKARQWFKDKVSEIGLAPIPDPAGNNWVTLPGESDKTVIVAGHLDSVPSGGWLDGSLGVTVALEALRRYAPDRDLPSPSSSWTGPTKRARDSDAASLAHLRRAARSSWTKCAP